MKRYNIVFVGNLNVYAKENEAIDTLRQLGHRITTFTHTRVQENKLGYIKANFLERIAWKLGFQFDDQKAGKKILDFVQKEKVDLVWISKGNMISPRVLKKLKADYSNLKLLSTSADNMYEWHNRTWFYTFGLKYYDLIFTTKRCNCDANELPRLGAKRVCFLYHTYDDRMHYPLELSDEDRRRYGAKVGFIGCYEKERAHSILYLAEHGVSVRVWGNGWERFRATHPNMQIEYKPVINDSYELAYTKTLCASDINLCFLRKMNRDLHTTRSLEIPACEGFMLAERTMDHSHLFVEGQETAFFSDNDELLQKVRYYLDHPKERKSIAVAGRQRCVNGGYSQRGRVENMLEEIEKLFFDGEKRCK